ncbi:hypothetical protein C2G38_592425 [Gigaspora rosea]|uniref:CCHC-type domain-containing protein n=1 Tax=Gigaspora rosea TaxID=44941 RepID=A0A397U704_9GLOM|nr:hypothetical protein C2G38_592425 [Gigaspora rosea]
MLTAFKKLETSVLGFDNRLNSVTAQIQDTRQKVEINDAWPNHKFEKYRDQHEYDTLRLVGRDLDFAVESRNVHDAINCIESAREKIANRIFTLRVTEGYGWDIAAALPDTQDDWLKGKDSLIEKAKVLAEVKKNKRQKSGKSGKYGFQKGYNDFQKGYSDFQREYNDFQKGFDYQENYRNTNSSSYRPFRAHSQSHTRFAASPGKCHICGGLGHFANTCPSDPNESTSNYRSRGYSTYKNRFSKSNETTRSD